MFVEDINKWWTVRCEHSTKCKNDAGQAALSENLRCFHGVLDDHDVEAVEEVVREYKKSARRAAGRRSMVGVITMPRSDEVFVAQKNTLR